MVYKAAMGWRKLQFGLINSSNLFQSGKETEMLTMSFPIIYFITLSLIMKPVFMIEKDLLDTMLVNENGNPLNGKHLEIIVVRFNSENCREFKSVADMLTNEIIDCYNFPLQGCREILSIN